jgi:phosphatidate cytidylyltransferase
LIARVTSSFLFLGLLLYGLYSGTSTGEYIILVVVAAATLAGTREYYQMARKMKVRPSPWPGYAVALAFLGDAFFFEFAHFLPIFIVCFWLLLITQVLLKHHGNSISNTACSLFGSIYVALPLAIVLDLFMHGSSKWGGTYAFAGGNMVLFLIVTSWATDIGGYCFGKPFGKHKLAPVLSPNKSIEGLVGGAVLALLFGFLLWKFSPKMDQSFSLIEALLLPVLFTIVGTVGDLAESAFKRDSDVKDSGKTYTGHGGMLDILDSLLLCAPVFYLYLTLTK